MALEVKGHQTDDDVAGRVYEMPPATSAPRRELALWRFTVARWSASKLV